MCARPHDRLHLSVTQVLKYHNSLQGSIWLSQHIENFFGHVNNIKLIKSHFFSGHEHQHETVVSFNIFIEKLTHALKQP